MRVPLPLTPQYFTDKGTVDRYITILWHLPNSISDLSSPSDHFARMETNIRRANLTLDGGDKKRKRASALTTTNRLQLEKQEDVAVTRKLLSLERTLKVGSP